jgi:pimeloyl-ACP methyl ester carboxylesterase
VYPVTLTGLGERSHLAHSSIDLDTHITDVANVLRYEDLHDVVLVGHSYAGLVVTGVADRLPDRVAQLAYVDTGPLPDGFSQNDFSAPDEQAANAALVAERGDGWQLPPPPWAALAANVPDVDEAAIATLQQRSTPQPWASATVPLRLTGAWEKLPRLGVLSSFTEQQARGMAAVVPAMRHMDGHTWRYAELPTWHWPMISRAGELGAILAGDQ